MLRSTSSQLGRLLYLLVPIAACSDARTPAPSAPVPSSPSTYGAPPRDATPIQAALSLGLTPLAVEAGVPRLLSATSAAAAPAPSASASARIHLGRLAPAWGVQRMPVLEPIGEVPVRGGTIVRMRQTLDGIPVDRGEVRVFVRPGTGELVGINGTLVGAEVSRAPATFRVDDAQAISIAIGHQYRAAFDAAALATTRRRGDGSRVLHGRSAGIDVQQASARKVWMPQHGALVPVWFVETFAAPVAETNGDAWETRVSADGVVLSHRSITDDATFRYRVWAETTGELHPLDGPHADFSPHPTGTSNGTYPPFVAPPLVTVDGLNHPGGSATPDPWLVTGRTETLGNNVEAYTDLNAPTGLTFGDFRATVTAPGVFDRTYDVAAEPLASQGQQMAGITALFFTINWLHDFWYDRGFTEAAGNAQDNNFNRGGEDRDAILAEAQDNANGGSRNNANMATPSDGLQPRMQVFLWTGRDDHSLTLQPSGRVVATGTAAFGVKNFDTNAPVILGDDATGTTTDACEPLANNVTGKIVLVDRGTCSFKSKALRVQEAGGAGVIIANNVASAQPPALGDDAAITTAITIGVASITQAQGVQLKTDLGAGAVTGVLRRLVGVEEDGTLDATVVAHEYGHYLHHRLSDCSTKLCGAQSEGWGDFTALMLMARAGDNFQGAFPIGIYSTVSFTTDPGYFGIRRAPYSVNPNINALSFRHMSDGQALPANAPFLIFGANSEVHNGGEIWAAALWEAYVAVLGAATTFEEGRAKMADYVVAGLLMSPQDGTPTENRDAILLAARAASPADHDAMIAAFARRGMGSCAVSPNRNSQNNAGIVESDEVKGRAVVGLATLVNVVACDADDVLDAGETARIKLPVTNPGHVDITNVTVTVTSKTEGVTVVTGPQSLATLAAYSSTNVEIEVKLADTVTGPAEGLFAIRIDNADGCVTETQTELGIRMNVDDVLAHSATDTFDTLVSVWAPGGNAITGFVQEREAPLDGIWRGRDNGVRTDTHLTSPTLTGGAGPVSVTFEHRFIFEGGSFDGGVIEVSTDGGATFQDVTALGVASPYNGTLTTASDNPLGGRAAFVNTSEGNPAKLTTTLDFGAALSNKTFQLRFRIATDGGVGAPGWELDDVAFTGIVGTPFPAQIANQGNCAQPPTPDGADSTPDAPGGTPDAGTPLTGEGGGGCCDAGPISTTNALASLGVLGLLLRRRRRS
ncbi:MAG: M36 family metallopeptidase [Deltaproteobacteria bacterium]|nr:M36 family metallopeptidase [Deltaproteobacteria bacterium]